MLTSGWCNAIIHLIHKKGSWTNQGNYRGISLLSSVSKVFTKLVNNRLWEWASDEEKLSDFQAGFRTGKSITDHVFVLQSMISKYLGKKG